MILKIETGRQPGGPPANAGQPAGLLVTVKRSTLKTDTNGRYLMALPVEKGWRFRAIAMPENHTLTGTEWITSDGMRPIVFEPITVTPLRTITGRVVDTDGRPVAAASVLNQGNPAPLTSAVTGPDGAFRLDGLPPGEVRVFVEAPGYRFHGQDIRAADSAVDMIVRRDEQTAERTIQPRASILSRAEAAALARQVITPYSDCVLKPGSDPNAKSRVLEVLAQIDPDKAWRKCQAGEAPWNHNAVRIVAVRQFADRDPEDAQAILPTITSEFWRNWTRFELIDRLPAARVERKVALLTEAVLDARRAGDPGAKVSKLMKAAGRFLDLGRDTEARKLVEEALPLARTVDASGHRLGSTRQVVANLARLDLNAALALIPAQGDERTSNDFRGLIAQHIAAANPAEAERLLNAMTRNNSPTYAVKACARMAPLDLPRSRRLAETINLDVVRAYALGKMADAMAGSDRPAARELLAESFQSFSKVMERGFPAGGVWGPNSAAPMAAALLPVVKRVAPDRLGESIDRILALRWLPRTLTDLAMTTPDTSNLESMRSRAALAALLVRYDRELARSIARPIIERFRTPLADVENRYLDRYAVLPTLTLADPRGMAELVEVIPDLKEEDLGQSRDMARLIVAKTLSAPESEFWTIIKGSVLELEFVERED